MRVYEILFDFEFEEKNIWRKSILSIIFFTWLFIVITLALHHEYWRDEVRALSIVIGTSSWLEISSAIKNEGHPILWYWVLALLYPILKGVTLPVLSIFFGAVAVALFLFRSPFNLAIKILFTFSVLPLYEYSVMSRNYGISMMLMFIFAALYKNRQKNLLPLTITLALLANTNLPALITSAGLTLVLFWDTLIEDQIDKRGNYGVQIFSGILLVIVAGIYSLVTIKPDDHTLLTNAHHIKSLTEYWASAKPAFLYPGRAISSIFPENFGIFTKFLPEIFIWILMLGLLTKPIAFFCLFISLFGVSFIYYFAYPLSLRHHGILWCLVITLYWICFYKSEVRIIHKPILFLHKIALMLILPLILIWGDAKAISKAKQDYLYDVSSSKSLGLWLSYRLGYKKAILIVEPDYLFEGIPYYSDINIYIPREKLFRKYGKSTDAQVQIISLREILSDAKKLHSESNTPILIGFAWPMESQNESGEIILPYGRKFQWNKTDLIEFKQSFQLVEKFDASKSDENFYIYEVKN
jgi:hypothetical protein